jgi:XTP/dITP diphosphohydrolase
MKLIIASNNQHKINEIKQILKPYFDGIVSMKDAGISIEIEENGDTFIENALIKARRIRDLTKEAALADDSGLCVDALGGRPGVFSARYSGKGDRENNLKLLKETENIENRSCRFVCAAAICMPDGREITAQGECEGELLRDFDGGNGFGYDPIFFCKELNKSFGRATQEEKNRVSHRFNALKKLAETLQKL